MVTETKISRKEAETISVPSWPKIDQLDMWKGKLLSNVLAGCGDPDSEAWSAWLAESFSPHVSIESLSTSGGSRLAGVDSMDKMIKSAGDQASEVALEVQQLIAKLIKGPFPPW